MSPRRSNRGAPVTVAWTLARLTPPTWELPVSTANRHTDDFHVSIIGERVEKPGLDSVVKLAADQ